MGEVVNKKWLTIKKRSEWKSHIGIGVRKSGSSCKAARGEIKFRKKKWQDTCILYNLMPKESLETQCRNWHLLFSL